MADESKDAPLNNNKSWRSVSDKLDSIMGTSYKDTSIIRGTLHATYHEYQYRATGNEREHERAKDQWNKAWGGNTDNLKKYDEEKAEKKRKEEEKNK